MTELLFKEECYTIQGAVFEVYREMGCGFLEAVYQECLEKELGRRGIPFISQQELSLTYKGEVLKQFCKPDLICYEKIIVELKEKRELSGRCREIPEDLFARLGAGFWEGGHTHVDAAVDAYGPAAPGSEEENRILGIARHVMLLSRPTYCWNILIQYTAHPGIRRKNVFCHSPRWHNGPKTS